MIHPKKISKEMIDFALNEAQKNLDAGIEPQRFEVKPSFFFMVGEYMLDISTIKIVYSGCQSGLVPNYKTFKEAWDALLDKTIELSEVP